MRHFRRMTAALLGSAGVALMIQLAGADMVGAAVAAPVPNSGFPPVPGASPADPNACIIGLNCGCIRGRTCPGDRRRNAVRPPEVRLDGAPVIAGDPQEGAPRSVRP